MHKLISSLVVAVLLSSVAGCSPSTDTVAGEYYIGEAKKDIMILEKDGSMRFRGPLAGNFEIDGDVLKISLADNRKVTAKIVSHDELEWGSGTPTDPPLRLLRVGSRSAASEDSDQSSSESSSNQGGSSTSVNNAVSPIEIKVVVKNDTVGTMYNGNTAVGPGLAISWNELHIIGRADQVKIRGVTVNRGNCALPSRTELPVDLKFGQQLKISIHRCDILEASVVTDQGDWSASFQ